MVEVEKSDEVAGKGSVAEGKCYFGEWSHGNKHGTGSTGKPFFDLNQVLSANDLDASFLDQFQPESLVEFVNDELVFTVPQALPVSS